MQTHLITDTLDPRGHRRATRCGLEIDVRTSREQARGTYVFADVTCKRCIKHMPTTRVRDAAKREWLRRRKRIVRDLTRRERRMVLGLDDDDGND